MVAQNRIIAEIQRNLQRCGYTDRLLQADYFYEDGMGKHTVPLAGFARLVHDSRTSCISVVTCDGLGEVRPEYVNEYRGIGAPVVFVCFQQEVQWWSIGTKGAEHQETISNDKLDDFFDKFKKDFAPERIWRAKNIGNVVKEQQLYFVDAGLPMLLEHEMGERLGGLMRRVIGLLRNGFTEKQLETAENQRWIFQAGFWILCAKILKDKGVREFTGLRIDDIDAVLEAVQTHYGSQQQVEIETRRQRQALEKAAGEINKFASLSNLTTEAFGYMYENVLVDKKLRSDLGIHATPSYLVDYMVWQLWPWIKQIPEDKRVVLELACGHAPFLTSAMRMLRFLYTGRESSFHEYAKDRLVGIEVDSFAREIARLSLTMADVPNPNGWQLESADVYEGESLPEIAKKPTILLCNPPFQNFTQEEKSKYHDLKCDNKAGEVLARTLPYMPAGSVFGVILPRSFLSKGGNAIPLRKMLVENFEIYEICVLPDKVFTWADHESVVILGRKRTSKRISNKTRFVRVREKTLDRFQDRYGAPTEVTEQVRFMASDDYDLSIPELEEVWSFCQSFNPLRMVVDEKKTGKGLEYRREESLPVDAETISMQRFRGSVRGYAKFDRKLKLTDTPKLYWMSLADEVIRRPGHGKETGVSQILLNSAPVSRGPWRLKALIDRKGHPVTSSFIVIRPKSKEWSIEVLWAILNSPLANAYIYCHATKRIVGLKRVLAFPIPNINAGDLYRLGELVKDYFRMVTSEQLGLQSGIDTKEAKKKMLAIDAEVMRLYDLPPKTEKRLLDLFQGIQRKGVDFSFRGYYHEGFESAVPLHEYLSEEYQRSTITFADEWVRKQRSHEINAILRKAVEAFEEG